MLIIMIYKYFYKTPKQFSNMIMISDGEYLTGLWFENSRDTLKHELNCEEKELPIFKEATKWLGVYFSGKNPDFTPKYKVNNLTPFRKEVIDIVNTVEYGKLLTYNDIFKTIAKNRSIEKSQVKQLGEQSV